MSTVSKVLLGLVIVAILPLFYLTAQTLILYRNWGQKANGYEATIEQLERDVAATRDGRGEAEPGVRDLRIALEDLASRRGRAWLPVQKVAAPTAEGLVAVAQLAGPQGPVPPPEGFLPFPLGLEPLGVVYAFTWPPPAPAPDGAEPGPAVPPPGSVQFVGSFRVREVDANRGIAQLEPLYTLSDGERQRMAANVPWMIAELMPRDDHETFAGLDEQTLRQFLPPEVIEEYLRDGQSIPAAALPTTDPSRVRVVLELRTPEAEALGPSSEGGEASTASVSSIDVTDELGQAMSQRGMGTVQREGATYQRPLRDFGYLDRELRHQRSLAQAALQDAERQRLLIESAVEDAGLEQQYRQREIQDLQAEVAHFEAETALLKEYASSLEAMRRELQQRIEALRAENLQLAQAL